NSAVSLDNLVGADHERCWKRESECFCWPGVENEFDLGQLHHREIGRLCAAEDAADIDAGLAIADGVVGPVAPQASRLGIVTCVEYRGDGLGGGERNQLLAPTIEKWTPRDEQRIGALLSDAREGETQLPLIARR